MSAKRSNRVNKKGFGTQMAEIRRCNDLRVRIMTYLKQKALTQAQLAEIMLVSNSQMSNFMNGTALTGSQVYTEGMKYLKTRMPLAMCSDEDRNQITNDKWKVVIGTDRS